MYRKETIIPLILSIALSTNCTDHNRLDTFPKVEEKSINWSHKDWEVDSIPGIGLERAYEELVDEEKGTEVVVAVLDTHVDIYHEDLVHQIYINKDEIPFNNIDDDRNGYIDDINGWNFLGMDNNRSVKYQLFAHTRIVRDLGKVFENMDDKTAIIKDSLGYKKFLSAKSSMKNSMTMYEGYLNGDTKEWSWVYRKVMETMGDRYFIPDAYTKDELDAMPKNDKERKRIGYLKDYIDSGISLEYLGNAIEEDMVNLYTCNNVNYDDREGRRDDQFYGNNKVDIPFKVKHGTWVSGVIAATRDNGIGCRGVSNNIRIMPLPLFSKGGNMNSKDFFNCVRYAVDNGARIINISGGVKMTENEQLFFDGLKYAQDNDVLVVIPAGNESYDIDIQSNEYFPKDIGPDGEKVDNVLKVGASTRFVSKDFIAPFSNYGKVNVDIFAPGQEMETTAMGNRGYSEERGTSLACALTSGVAATILSYYPEMSSKELKALIMDSGRIFDIQVETVTGETMDFDQLSKSGKLLNIYNALKIAAGK